MYLALYALETAEQRFVLDINKHVCLEIGTPGLNIIMTVDIAITHLDSQGPRSDEILPFLMTDTKIYRLFGRFRRSTTCELT